MKQKPYSSLAGCLSGIDAVDIGYFAYGARGRWFESNPVQHGLVAQLVERLRVRFRRLLDSIKTLLRGQR